MFWSIVIGVIIGYLIGHYLRPNKRVRKKLQEIKEKYVTFLEEGRKGVYRTIVTDKNKTSELVVEVKELAITENGHVKVQFLSAYYKNPEFRTKKGNALLREVHGLLGEYLPLNEIEWFDNSEKKQQVKQHLHTLEEEYKHIFRN